MFDCWRAYQPQDQINWDKRIFKVKIQSPNFPSNPLVLTPKKICQTCDLLPAQPAQRRLAQACKMELKLLSGPENRRSGMGDPRNFNWEEPVRIHQNIQKSWLVIRVIRVNATITCLKKPWIDHVDAVHLLYNITDYLNVDKTNADPSGLSPQCRPWVARTLLWAWADRTASLPSESQPHWKCGRKMRCEKPGLLGFIWCHPKNVPKCHSNLWILEQKKLWQIVGQFLDMPIFQSTKMTWWCCEKLQKWRLHTEYFLQEESDSKRWRYHAAGERQTFQGGVPSLLSSSATASSSSPSPPPSMLPSCLIKQCFQKWSPVQVQGFSTKHAWWMQLPRAQAFTAEL